MHTTGIRSLSFWSVCDQAVVSLGTFLTNIILARNLPATDYGIYTLLWVTALFLNRVHSSLVTQPLSIQAGAVAASEMPGYVAGSIQLTLGLVCHSLRPFSSRRIHRTAGPRLGLGRGSHPMAGSGNTTASPDGETAASGDAVGRHGQLSWPGRLDLVLVLGNSCHTTDCFCRNGRNFSYSDPGAGLSDWCRFLERSFGAQSRTSLLAAWTLGPAFPLSQSIHGPSISLDVSDISWH